MENFFFTCTYREFIGMSYVGPFSEGSSSFIWLQLNDTQTIIIRFASLIGRPSASYFVL